MAPSPLPPSEENALVSVSDTPVENSLAAADPLWLHRTLLGVGGLIISQVVVLLSAVGGFFDLLGAGRLHGPIGLLAPWVWQLGDVGVAIEWFSALYLLALPQFSRDGDDPFRLPRRWLLVLGCAWVILRYMPTFFVPPAALGSWRVAETIAHLGAMVALFLYLMKIAELAKDSFLKTQLPFALVLLVLRRAFAAFMPQVEAENMRLLLVFASAGYWLYLMLQMRAMLAAITFTPRPPES